MNLSGFGHRPHAFRFTIIGPRGSIEPLDRAPACCTCCIPFVWNPRKSEDVVVFCCSRPKAKQKSCQYCHACFSFYAPPIVSLTASFLHHDLPTHPQPCHPTQTHTTQQVQTRPRTCRPPYAHSSFARVSSHGKKDNLALRPPSPWLIIPPPPPPLPHHPIIHA